MEKGRLLIDVGKFAVYQTDGFLFFASPSLWCCEERRGGLPGALHSAPRQDSCLRASRQGLGQVHLPEPGWGPFAALREPERGWRRLAESCPLNSGRMVALISAVALIFHPGLTGLNLGARGKSPGRVSWWAACVPGCCLYKLAACFCRFLCKRVGFHFLFITIS